MAGPVIGRNRQISGSIQVRIPRAIAELAKALSSEVGTGSREENALK
jgi:hypothetical protein